MALNACKRFFQINSGSAEEWMATVLPQKQHAGIRMKMRSETKDAQRSKAESVYVCKKVAIEQER